MDFTEFYFLKNVSKWVIKRVEFAANRKSGFHHALINQMEALI